MADSYQSCPECGIVLWDTNDLQETYCAGCGYVIHAGNNLSTAVEFDSHGGLVHRGEDVDFETGKGIGHKRTGSLLTLHNAREKIANMARALRLDMNMVERAARFFKLAHSYNFGCGRRTEHVVASCLYLVCRLEKKPNMLLDFCDILQTNKKGEEVTVHTLGNTFVSLCRVLKISKLPLVDPSLFIERFAQQLEFGDKTLLVSQSALRIVQAMYKDWILTGRRPNGIIGAALMMAARLHGFDRTTEDVVEVVRIGSKTLNKRINEFVETPTSGMTPSQFNTMEVAGDNTLPPCFKKDSGVPKRKQRKKIRENQRLLRSFLRKHEMEMRKKEGIGYSPSQLEEEEEEEEEGEEDESQSEKRKSKGRKKKSKRKSSDKKSKKRKRDQEEEEEEETFDASRALLNYQKRAARIIGYSEDSLKTQLLQESENRAGEDDTYDEPVGSGAGRSEYNAVEKEINEALKFAEEKNILKSSIATEQKLHTEDEEEEANGPVALPQSTKSQTAQTVPLNVSQLGTPSQCTSTQPDSQSLSQVESSTQTESQQIESLTQSQLSQLVESQPDTDPNEIESHTKTPTATTVTSDDIDILDLAESQTQQDAFEDQRDEEEYYKLLLGDDDEQKDIYAEEYYELQHPAAAAAATGAPAAVLESGSKQESAVTLEEKLKTEGDEAPLPSNPEEDVANFTDDEEVLNCILTEEEKKQKEKVWLYYNREYLKEQLEKQKQAEVEKLNPRQRKRRKKAQSASESLLSLKNKFPKSAKINFDAAKDLLRKIEKDGIMDMIAPAAAAAAAAPLLLHPPSSSEKTNKELDIDLEKDLEAEEDEELNWNGEEEDWNVTGGEGELEEEYGADGLPYLKEEEE